jgi:hypothetical protein
MTSFTTHVIFVIREIKLLLQKRKPSESNQNRRKSAIFQADYSNAVRSRKGLVKGDDPEGSNDQVDLDSRGVQFESQLGQ